MMPDDFVIADLPTARFVRPTPYEYQTILPLYSLHLDYY